MNKNPVEIFKLDIPKSIEEGIDATFMIFKNEEWIINEAYFKSKSRNNAFLGEKVNVRVIYTLVDGELKLNNGE